jgi:transcriptional regulator with XRE-family HTH domain
MRGSQEAVDAIRFMLEKRGISQRNFASEIGMEKGTLGNILKRISCFPLDKLNEACRILDLGIETEAYSVFRKAIYLSHAPEEIRKMVTDLEVKLLKSEQESLRLSQTLAKLRQAMISAGIQVPEVDLDI